jgi:hypothetical protein
MRRWIGTALVITALVGIPAMAGMVASSRPAGSPRRSHRIHPRVQVSSSPIIGYGTPVKTSFRISGR